jgi:energy-coupling factor transporter ATP-binding protein EcfA2
MVKLKRLKIEKFRNVAPGTELHFRDSLNVLLGKNGTGKTTLLNLIVQLLNWDFSPLLLEPISVEYELETSGGHLRVRLRNEAQPASFEFLPNPGGTPAEEVGESFVTAGESYGLSGEVLIRTPAPRQERLVEFKGSTLSLSTPGDSMSTRKVGYRAPIAGKRTLLILVEVLLGLKEPWVMQVLGYTGAMGALFLRRFDESLGYLNHITRAETVFRARRGAQEYWVLQWGGEPQGVAQEIQRRLGEDSNADEVSLRSDDPAAEFLERPRQLLGFESAKIRVQRIARETEPLEVIHFGNIRFDFARRDSSVINHSLLSYGQKRLFSFYYYLACSRDCIVADELVNGMHHEWIDACLEDLGDRQAFLTSQNPLLLDYLGFKSAEEVRSSFVLCRSELSGTREQLHWENMTQEDAEGFLSAYQVGVQHVSELLRTRGLW